MKIGGVATSEGFVEVLVSSTVKDGIALRRFREADRTQGRCNTAALAICWKLQE
jgi:hypothetical protein